MSLGLHLLSVIFAARLLATTSAGSESLFKVSDGTSKDGVSRNPDSGREDTANLSEMLESGSDKHQDSSDGKREDTVNLSEMLDGGSEKQDGPHHHDDHPHSDKKHEDREDTADLSELLDGKGDHDHQEDSTRVSENDETTMSSTTDLPDLSELLDDANSDKQTGDDRQGSSSGDGGDCPNVHEISVNSEDPMSGPKKFYSELVKLVDPNGCLDLLRGMWNDKQDLLMKPIPDPEEATLLSEPPRQCYAFALLRDDDTCLKFLKLLKPETHEGDEDDHNQDHDHNHNNDHDHDHDHDHHGHPVEIADACPHIQAPDDQEGLLVRIDEFLSTDFPNLDLLTRDRCLAALKHGWREAITKLKQDKAHSPFPEDFEAQSVRAKQKCVLSALLLPSLPRGARCLRELEVAKHRDDEDFDSFADAEGPACPGFHTISLGNGTVIGMARRYYERVSTLAGPAKTRCWQHLKGHWDFKQYLVRGGVPLPESLDDAAEKDRLKCYIWVLITDGEGCLKELDILVPKQRQVAPPAVVGSCPSDLEVEEDASTTGAAEAYFRLVLELPKYMKWKCLLRLGREWKLRERLLKVPLPVPKRLDDKTTKVQKCYIWTLLQENTGCLRELDAVYKREETGLDLEEKVEDAKKDDKRHFTGVDSWEVLCAREGHYCRADSECCDGHCFGPEKHIGRGICRKGKLGFLDDRCTNTSDCTRSQAGLGCYGQVGRKRCQSLLPLGGYCEVLSEGSECEEGYCSSNSGECERCLSLNEKCRSALLQKQCCSGYGCFNDVCTSLKAPGEPCGHSQNRSECQEGTQCVKSGERFVCSDACIEEDHPCSPGDTCCKNGRCLGAVGKKKCSIGPLKEGDECSASAECKEDNICRIVDGKHKCLPLAKEDEACDQDDDCLGLGEKKVRCEKGPSGNKTCRVVLKPSDRCDAAHDRCPTPSVCSQTSGKCVVCLENGDRCEGSSLSCCHGHCQGPKGAKRCGTEPLKEGQACEERFDRSECAKGLICSATKGICEPLCKAEGTKCQEKGRPCCGALRCLGKDEERRCRKAIAPGKPCSSKEEDECSTGFKCDAEKGLCLGPPLKEGEACGPRVKGRDCDSSLRLTCVEHLEKDGEKKWLCKGPGKRGETCDPKKRHSGCDLGLKCHAIERKCRSEQVCCGNEEKEIKWSKDSSCRGISRASRVHFFYLRDDCEGSQQECDKVCARMQARLNGEKIEEEKPNRSEKVCADYREAQTCLAASTCLWRKETSKCEKLPREVECWNLGDDCHRCVSEGCTFSHFSRSCDVRNFEKHQLQKFAINTAGYCEADKYFEHVSPGFGTEVKKCLAALAGEAGEATRKEELRGCRAILMREALLKALKPDDGGLDDVSVDEPNDVARAEGLESEGLVQLERRLRASGRGGHLVAHLHGRHVLLEHHEHSGPTASLKGSGSGARHQRLDQQEQLQQLQQQQQQQQQHRQKGSSISLLSKEEYRHHHHLPGEVYPEEEYFADLGKNSDSGKSNTYHPDMMNGIADDDHDNIDNDEEDVGSSAGKLLAHGRLIGNVRSGRALLQLRGGGLFQRSRACPSSRCRTARRVHLRGNRLFLEGERGSVLVSLNRGHSRRSLLALEGQHKARGRGRSRLDPWWTFKSRKLSDLPFCKLLARQAEEEAEASKLEGNLAAGPSPTAPACVVEDFKHHDEIGRLRSLELHELQQSLSKPLKLEGSSVFALTEDERYMIVEIPLHQDEARNQKANDMLDPLWQIVYEDRLLKHLQGHPDSLLQKVFGILKLELTLDMTSAGEPSSLLSLTDPEDFDLGNKNNDGQDRLKTAQSANRGTSQATMQTTGKIVPDADLKDLDDGGQKDLVDHPGDEGEESLGKGDGDAANKENAPDIIGQPAREGESKQHDEESIEQHDSGIHHEQSTTTDKPQIQEQGTLDTDHASDHNDLNNLNYHNHERDDNRGNDGDGENTAAKDQDASTGNSKGSNDDSGKTEEHSQSQNADATTNSEPTSKRSSKVYKRESFRSYFILLTNPMRRSKSVAALRGDDYSLSPFGWPDFLKHQIEEEWGAQDSSLCDNLNTAVQQDDFLLRQLLFKNIEPRVATEFHGRRSEQKCHQHQHQHFHLVPRFESWQARSSTQELLSHLKLSQSEAHTAQPIQATSGYSLIIASGVPEETCEAASFCSKIAGQNVIFGLGFYWLPGSEKIISRTTEARGSAYVDEMQARIRQMCFPSEDPKTLLAEPHRLHDLVVKDQLGTKKSDNDGKKDDDKDGGKDRDLFEEQQSESVCKEWASGPKSIKDHKYEACKLKLIRDALLLVVDQKPRLVDIAARPSPADSSKQSDPSALDFNTWDPQDVTPTLCKDLVSESQAALKDRGRPDQKDGLENSQCWSEYPANPCQVWSYGSSDFEALRDAGRKGGIGQALISALASGPFKGSRPDPSKASSTELYATKDGNFELLIERLSADDRGSSKNVMRIVTGDGGKLVTLQKHIDESRGSLLQRPFLMVILKLLGCDGSKALPQEYLITLLDDPTRGKKEAFATSTTPFAQYVSWTPRDQSKSPLPSRQNMKSLTDFLDKKHHELWLSKRQCNAFSFALYLDAAYLRSFGLNHFGFVLGSAEAHRYRKTWSKVKHCKKWEKPVCMESFARVKKESSHSLVEVTIEGEGSMFESGKRRHHRRLSTMNANAGQGEMDLERKARTRIEERVYTASLVNYWVSSAGSDEKAASDAVQQFKDLCHRPKGVIVHAGRYKPGRGRNKHGEEREDDATDDESDDDKDDDDKEEEDASDQETDEEADVAAANVEPTSKTGVAGHSFTSILKIIALIVVIFALIGGGAYYYNNGSEEGDASAMAVALA